MQTNARHNTLKVPQTDDEDIRLRKLCSSLGLQRAPFVRRAIETAIKAHLNHRRVDRERPRHGHIPVCPGRATFGGAPTPMRL
jgi:hypothetical protein